MVSMKLISLLPSFEPGKGLGAHRKRWSERLQEAREGYLKDEGTNSLSERTGGSDTFVSDMKSGSFFASTVSSHTLLNGNINDDVEMLRPSGVRDRKRGPGLGLWRKENG